MPSTPVHPLRRLLRYGSRHRRIVWSAVACSVLNKLFDLAPPALIGMAVDIVVEQQDSLLARWGVVDVAHQLYVLAALTVVVWALESVFEYAFKLLWRNLAQTIQHELRLDAYGHIQRLDSTWFQARSTGGLMSVLNDDVNQLERFLDGGANDILQVGTTVVAVTATFFGLAPVVAVLATVPIPVILWGSFHFQKRIAPRYATVRERVAALNGLLANNLGGIETIKSFATEELERQRVGDESQAYRQANAEAIRLSSAFTPLIRMAIVVGFVGTLIYGGMLALDGTLAVGSYSVLVFLTQRLLWPLTRLGDTVDQYQRAMASTSRIMDLLDTEVVLVQGERKLDPTEARGDLRFQGVGFAYPGGNPVLDAFDLTVPAGQTVALVGPTGAGKSTVIRLALRLYDPDAGTVSIDGIDLRELTLDSLRRAVGLVSQSVFLFPGSVRENIAYGRPDATLDEIQAAARAAEAHEFIAALPQGYDTVVGERGQKLSGGQRQRLSIARALLKDAPVLVLDEATSAVDNETEAAIQHSIERVQTTHKKTLLVIAHRLSTIRHADRIIVMDGGRIVEQGRHEELLSTDGLYARLWRVQTGERAPRAAK